MNTQFDRALDEVIAGLQRTITGLNMLREAGPVPEEADREDFDPKDPANKYEIGGLEKLTPRGAEICYRLFDAGKSRYAVADLMGISFGAANHRYGSWLKAGGAQRRRMPLSNL